METAEQAAQKSRATGRTADRSTTLADRLAFAASKTPFIHELVLKLSPSDAEMDAIKAKTLADFDAFKKDHPELFEQAAKEAFAVELVKRATTMSAIAGGVTSLPIGVPYIGPIVSMTARIGILFAFITRVEIDLVIALAALYNYSWNKKELLAISFILIGLSDYEDVKKYALEMGVKITVKKLVIKLVEYVAIEIGQRAISQMVQPAIANVGSNLEFTQTPFLVRLLSGSVSVGIGAFFSHQSVKSLGRRTQYFFGGGEED